PSTSEPLVTSIESGANTSSSFGYNSDFDLTSTSGFGTGGCTSVPVTRYQYTRDTAGRLTAVHHIFAYGTNCGSPEPIPADDPYTYYPNGRVQQYTGSDGTRAYTYNSRGLVDTMTVTLNG